jgi:hypothetical protein
MKETNEKEELWIKQLKKQLEDYVEPVPEAGWEALEKELAKPATPVVPPRRPRLYIRRLQWAAAAAVLIAVCATALYLLNLSDADTEQVLPHSVVAAEEPKPLPSPTPIPEPDEPVVQPVRSRDLLAVATPSRQNKPVTPAEEPAVMPVESASTTPTTSEQPAVRQEESAVRQEEPAKSPQEEEKHQPRYRPSDRSKLQLPVEKKSRKQQSGWAVGASVGNGGGVSTGNNVLSYNTMGASSPLNLGVLTQGAVQIEKGEQIVFDDGVPHFKVTDKPIEAHHKQPVSVAVSLRKNLPHGFSVETGLMYTLLASDITLLEETQPVSQKLHYLGIPVRANWNFVELKHFTFYVSAGGAIEKCVYGKQGEQKLTVNPVQFSVTGAVGAQYDINKRLGIYVEPGVSYYFDDGSSVQTIRKERPCNFNLQAGFRISY